MTTQLKKLIGCPAKCTFDVIRNLTKEEILAAGYPENIVARGLYSAIELADALSLNLAHHYEQREQKAPKVKLEDYILLQRPFNEFLWFIAYGKGTLTAGRPISACPFNDPLLYVPVGWGDKVMSAAGTYGFCRFEREGDDELHHIYGIRADGNRESAEHLINSKGP